MTTLKQVEQILDLALSLVRDLEQAKPHEIKNLQVIASHIQEALKPSVYEEVTPVKTLKHPVDVLLKKGKVELDERRYQQLVVIYDELTAVNIKFLSAKQNQHVTWFPLVGMEGDKSAALFLSGGGWTVEPISPKANGELTGEWQGWDLLEHLAANCPDLDLDDY